MEVWTPDALKDEIEKGGVVFLKLWKRGCGACKLSIPALDRIEPAYADQAVFGQVAADEHPEMLEIAETDVLPVFFIFKNKQMTGKHIGFKGLKSLQEFVEKELGAPAKK